MKVRIKRVDSALPLPKYETDGAVGFDLLAREDTVVKPSEIALIPGNVVVEVPNGYMLMVTLRSSAPRKHGVIMPHGVGVIDQDYCGAQDEVKIQVQNFTSESVTILRGTRIAQGIFVKIDRSEWEEVTELNNETRGGFGSTG